jgi:hypothetical protein
VLLKNLSITSIIGSEDCSFVGVCGHNTTLGQGALYGRKNLKEKPILSLKKTSVEVNK